MEIALGLVGAAAVLAVAVLIWLAAKRNRASKEPDPITQIIKIDSSDKYCLILNPSKPNYEEVLALIKREFADRGISNYIIKDTTIEFPGNRQAIEAIDEGCNIIIACGGDGTVRSAACGIARYADKPQNVEMGIIPMGTGNILAHNLGLPVNNYLAALQIALLRRARPIDIGFCRRMEDEHFEHAFVIIAGVGFDANMVKATNSASKGKFGPLAYYAAGFKESFRKKVLATIKITRPDGSELVAQTKLRTVMVGNCGRIPGFTLIPQAAVNDGILDIAAVDTSVGLLGWGQLAFDLFLQNFNISNTSKYKAGRIDHIQCHSAEIKLDRPQEMQLDGDLLGKTSHVKFYIRPKALAVRY